MTQARASGEAAARELLREILPGVSRSFALSLRVLPASLRHPFGAVSYTHLTLPTIYSV